MPEIHILTGHLEFPAHAGGSILVGIQGIILVMDLRWGGAEFPTEGQAPAPNWRRRSL